MTSNINEMFEAAVQERVRSVLSPIQEALAKLSLAIPAPLPSQETPKRRSAGKGTPGTFQAGQKVLYRQGRGEFEATVVHVDATKDAVTVERAKDGKKVTRPAAKLYPTN